MVLTDFKYISVAEPGSFARLTLGMRLLSILDKVKGSELFDDVINESLTGLKQSLPFLKVQQFPLAQEETRYWKRFFETYDGKSIIEIPFFFAEMYFYRYLLHITQYASNKKDPFLLMKSEDLRNKTDSFEQLLQKANTLEDAIFMSLAGNKADLSQLERNDSSLNMKVNHSKELSKTN